MNILSALKSVSGSAFRVTNFGTDDYARWLFWDADSSEYVVLASKNNNELGTQVYRGDSEDDAVSQLLLGTHGSFVNPAQFSLGVLEAK